MKIEKVKIDHVAHYFKHFKPNCLIRQTPLRNMNFQNHNAKVT